MSSHRLGPVLALQFLERLEIRIGPASRFARHLVSPAEAAEVGVGTKTPAAAGSEGHPALNPGVDQPHGPGEAEGARRGATGALSKSKNLLNRRQRRLSRPLDAEQLEPLRAVSIQLQRGHGTLFRFLEGDGDPVGRAEDPQFLFVGREELVEHFPGHIHSQPLVGDLDHEIEIGGFRVVGSQIGLQLRERGFRLHFNSLAWKFEGHPGLVHLEAHHRTLTVAVEGDCDLVGQAEKPLSLVIRQLELVDHLPRDIDCQAIPLHHDGEERSMERAEVRFVLAGTGREVLSGGGRLRFPGFAAQESVCDQLQGKVLERCGGDVGQEHEAQVLLGQQRNFGRKTVDIAAVLHDAMARDAVQHPSQAVVHPAADLHLGTPRLGMLLRGQQDAALEGAVPELEAQPLRHVQHVGIDRAGRRDAVEGAHRQVLVGPALLVPVIAAAQGCVAWNVADRTARMLHPQGIENTRGQKPAPGGIRGGAGCHSGRHDHHVVVEEFLAEGRPRLRARGRAQHFLRRNGATGPQDAHPGEAGAMRK